MYSQALWFRINNPRSARRTPNTAAKHYILNYSVPVFRNSINFIIYIYFSLISSNELLNGELIFFKSERDATPFCIAGSRSALYYFVKSRHMPHNRPEAHVQIRSRYWFNSHMMHPLARKCCIQSCRGRLNEETSRANCEYLNETKIRRDSMSSHLVHSKRCVRMCGCGYGATFGFYWIFKMLTPARSNSIFIYNHFRSYLVKTHIPAINTLPSPATPKKIYGWQSEYHAVFSDSNNWRLTSDKA